MNLLDEYKEATGRVEPGEYARYLQSVTLLGLVLDSVSAEANRQCLQEGNDLKLKINRDFRLVHEDALRPIILLDYVILGMVGRKQAIRIKATYRIQLGSPEALPADFLVIYGRSSADMQVWPFLRELAFSLTNRMAITQMTLPLLTSPQRLDR